MRIWYIVVTLHSVNVSGRSQEADLELTPRLRHHTVLVQPQLVNVYPSGLELEGLWFIDLVSCNETSTHIYYISYIMVYISFSPVPPERTKSESRLHSPLVGKYITIWHYLPSMLHVGQLWN